MHFRYLLLLALAAVAACQSTRPAVFSKNSRPLTILTYNIRYDNPNDGADRWELRRDALAKEVMRHRPAIVGLQEVLAHQLAFLEANLKGYRRIGVGRDDGLEKGEFSPLFFDTTAFRLLYSRTLWLSPTPDVPTKAWDAALPRIATLVILQEKNSGDSLWAVNTHFDHIGKEARLHSAELIAKTLAPALAAGQKVIFMGDLNAEPNEPPIEFLKKHFSDACPAAQSNSGTFNGFEIERTQFKRIDYVWYAPGRWKMLGYTVPQPKVGGRHVSDHFPVLVRLE